MWAGKKPGRNVVCFESLLEQNQKIWLWIGTAWQKAQFVLQYSHSVAIPHGVPVLKCAGEPVPFPDMGKDFMHANGTATVTGDIHLRIWRRTLDCPQKQQMGNGVISGSCFKMSAAVRWLSLLKRCTVLGATRPWSLLGFLVLLLLAGSSWVHLLESHVSQGGTSADPAVSEQGICRPKPRRDGERLGAQGWMPAGEQPSELVGLKAEVSLLFFHTQPLRSYECPFSFAKVRDSPLQAILSFLLVAAHHSVHLGHYVQVWPLTISH